MPKLYKQTKRNLKAWIYIYTLLLYIDFVWLFANSSKRFLTHKFDHNFVTEARNIFIIAHICYCHINVKCKCIFVTRSKCGRGLCICRLDNGQESEHLKEGYVVKHKSKNQRTLIKQDYAKETILKNIFKEAIVSSLKKGECLKVANHQNVMCKTSKFTLLPKVTGALFGL